MILLLLLSYFFSHLATIKAPSIFLYGGFIFIYVYALTELLDRNPNAWVYELLKATMGISILYYQGDWFGISHYTPYFARVFVIYFLISLGTTFYFSLKDKTTNPHRQSTAV
jgi:hypothetical protein